MGVDVTLIAINFQLIPLPFGGKVIAAGRRGNTAGEENRQPCYHGEERAGMASESPALRADALGLKKRTVS